LGWNEANIRREENIESGRIDYTLLYQDAPIIIIEAKKAGEYFEIPKSMTNRRYKLRGAIETVANLTKAIEQARRYCDDIGCKYAAVCNGYQLVIFVAITLGKNWKDGYCYAFHSLVDIKENFNLFWNMLSYEQVISRSSLIEHLEKGKRELSFQKTIADIHFPDQCWARNRLYSQIRPISDFVFTEILDEARADVLKRCYVYGRSTNPLSNDIEDYFIDKLPHFAEKFKIKDIIERESKAGAFEKEYIIRAFEQDKPVDGAKGSLLVLLGGIGAGKSTFLLRFFRLVLHEHENLLWFYVDFKSAPPNETEIEAFILHKMLEEWEVRYSPKIRPIIEDYGFDTTATDKKKYFSKLFKLLNLLKFSMTLVVDNVDRHDASFQEKIFLCCQHLTDVLRTVSIVAMREETFILSTKVGIFDAYNVPKFHIAAPNFLEMITKRIEFTIGMISAEAISKLLPRITQEDVEELKKYFLILKHSLQKTNEQSRKIVRFMHNVSVGNMREALEMFNKFIVSGNTNIEEIFRIFDATGEYQIAYHQYVKSIMLGEYRYYTQSRSHIMNLYDFDTSISDSHFNLLRILHYLLKRTNVGSRIGRGYVDISDLVNVASSAFIKKEVIKDSLLRLSRFNLVEYDNQSKTEISTAAFVKITAAGQYYLKHLKHEFVYLDSVYIDSSISDHKTATYLKRLANCTDLGSRLERVKIFIEYLNKFEDDEFREHPEYLSNEFANVKFARDIVKAFKIEESEIRAKNKLPIE
jgi:hypothetical protein